MIYVIFGVFVICGIIGSMYFHKTVSILQEENVPTTFADR